MVVVILSTLIGGTIIGLLKAMVKLPVADIPSAKAFKGMITTSTSSICCSFRLFEAELNFYQG